MWIFGAKKWTADAQNRRIAARINGNLGYPSRCGVTKVSTVEYAVQTLVHNMLSRKWEAKSAK
jgi:hypothetical protein